jgi:hypothetical protein
VRADSRDANREAEAMSLSTPQQVMERLEAIEAEILERQNDYEKAAGDKAKLTRQWEKRLAICRLKAKGADADTRKAAALAMAAEQDELYENLSEAETNYAICYAALKQREVRIGIGQSILKAQGRA